MVRSAPPVLLFVLLLSMLRRGFSFSPRGNFLSTATESYQRTPFETKVSKLPWRAFTKQNLQVYAREKRSIIYC